MHLSIQNEQKFASVDFGFSETCFYQCSRTVVKVFLLTKRTRGQMCALTSAVKSKRFRQAKILIEMGNIDVNARDETKRTALMELCFLEEENKAAKLARMLLSHGARVGIRDTDGMTALSYAAKLGREQLVSAMMEEVHSFDPNAADKHGNTALHYASMSGNFVVLNLILKTLKRFKLSADKPNNAGETPLICASKTGNFLCARILVSEGKASESARDRILFKTAREWGRTKESLRSASKSPLFRTLQLPAREDCHDNDEDFPTRPRPHTAPQRGERNHRELLRLLFKLYEGHVSPAYRPASKPRPVEVEPPISPDTVSETESEFSEFGDFLAGLNSPSSSGRRLSIGKASSLASNANTAFRRRSIATMGLGNPNAGRRLSVTSGTSGRRSSQSMSAPKIRRGSINVIGKLNMNLQATKRESLEKGPRMRRSSVDVRSKTPSNKDSELIPLDYKVPDNTPSTPSGPARSRSRTPSRPPSFSNLHTLAEGSDAEEEEEEEALHRSSPAALYSHR
ncbi:predicted protein [Nematostella vectensis]|uniref:Uncharacterized protein n=1 Tax=Nematostella vectensis TaxID=45351 RepID=A7SDI0_NEMVE|nr:predicted protein [Nematostella vectensis]|eukprot:XP_001630326.1 predicted protein [Nematostella vectensis]